MTVFAGYGMTYLSDLKAIAPAERCDLMCIAVLEKKAWYQFSATATDTTDNNLVVAPNEGDGRWLALGAPSSGGSGSGGSGSSNQTVVYRNFAGSPTQQNITPDFPGQIYVGGDVQGSQYANHTVWVAFGATVDDWLPIFSFSNS